MTLKIFIKRKYFDQILSGEKKTEYREVKKFWTCRLYSVNGKKIPYSKIEFINGMRSDSPRLITQCLGFDKKGSLYHIKIGRILKKMNR
jgi:hypothetical protein